MSIRRLSALSGTRKRRELLKASALFDVHWYCEKNALGSIGEDAAVEHYLIEGGSTRPHPLFDLRWYQKCHPELGEFDRTPLEHFIEISARLGASPCLLFDPKWYREQAKLDAEGSDDLLRHYLMTGGPSGVSPHVAFDAAYYLKQNKQLGAAGVNPLTHFIECGAIEGLNPNRLFDCGWYLSSYPDVHQAGLNPLVHFIEEGAEKGLKPHPLVDIDRYMVEKYDHAPPRLQAYYDMLADTAIDPNKQLAGLGSQIASRRTPAPGAGGFAIEDFEVFGDQLDAGDRLPPLADKPSRLRVDVGRGIRLVSLDVWDTLLRRDCHPDEVKLQSARFLFVSAYEQLRPAFRDLVALYKARIKAENDSAADPTVEEHEYRFEDAVERWLAVVLSPATSDRRRKELQASLARHEFDAERRATRVDAGIGEVLGELSAPLIFASDFYMSTQFLDNLLREHGLAHHFLRGYASSDRLETKRSGRMFDRIIEDLEVAPAQVLHIGDNPNADVTRPAQKGFATTHYSVAAETSRQDWYHGAFSALLRGDATLHERRLAGLVDEVARGLAEEKMGGERSIGARLAPIAVGYVLGGIEQAVRVGVDKIHYFTREGQFFKRVHEAIVASDPYSMTYPNSELLELSRRATFAASLRRIDARSLMRLWSLYSKQSIKGLAASLNLDEGTVRSLATRWAMDYEAVVAEPWRQRLFLAFLESPDFQSIALESVRKQREGLLAYLEATGARSRRVLMISDIGWRGTIQDNLAHLLDTSLISGSYLGLHRFLNAQPPNVRKAGWLFDEPAGVASQITDVAPFEMLFNGPGGSVVGFDTSGGTPRPIRVVVDDEERIIVNEVAAIQSGLLDTVGPILDYVRLHGLTSEELRRLGQSLARTLARRPPQRVADIFARLHHNETFGTGTVSAMDGSVVTAARGHSGSRLHRAVAESVASHRWPEGALGTSAMHAWWRDAPHAVRRALPSAATAVYAPARVRALGSKIAIFVPPPLRASGGHRTIFNLVRRLATLGFEPTVLLEGIGAGIEVVEEYLAGAPVAISTSWHRDVASDVAFATIAHSAARVAELSGCHHRCYLVQDFEALFNPMSDGFVTAENSYALGLQHFTVGNWLSHVINTRYGAASAPAGLGVDTDVYRVLPERSGVRRELAVCFLYQPEKPRRTPLLGIDALRRVKALMPEVKIYCYGSDNSPNLDFEVDNLGLITDLEDLNALYNRCTAGLCISASNPSRIPYEMMAAGCVPIDLYRYNNLLDHEAGTLLLAYQNSESIAEALLSVLSDGKRAQSMSGAGRAFMASRTLRWETDVMCNDLLALLQGQLPKTMPFDLLYGAEPIIAQSGDISSIKRFCADQLRMATQPVPDLE
ncbi:MAG: hypothetical protein R3D44_03375 [Hyphomicrobiaceae bacterium]